MAGEGEGDYGTAGEGEGDMEGLEAFLSFAEFAVPLKGLILPLSSSVYSQQGMIAQFLTAEAFVHQSR